MVQQCTNIHEINIDQILLAIQWFNVISHILRELPKIDDWHIFQCVAVVGLSDVKGGARVGRRARREGGLQDDNQSGAFPSNPASRLATPPSSFAFKLSFSFLWDTVNWTLSQSSLVQARNQNSQETVIYGRLPSAPPAFHFRKYLSTKAPPPQVAEASSSEGQGWRTERTTGSSTPSSTSSGDPYGTYPFSPSLRTNH